MYPLSLMNTSSMQLSGVEVGVHYYWDIAGISLHGQVFIVMWFVIILLLGAAIGKTINSLDQKIFEIHLNVILHKSCHQKVVYRYDNT